MTSIQSAFLSKWISSVTPAFFAALRSQYPMLGVAVGYTMLSLWIIAQPIVSSRFS